MINKHSKNIISNSGHIVKIITSTIKKNLLLSFFNAYKYFHSHSSQ